MSIFGKKPNAPEIPDGDAAKQASLEVPNFDKYMYQTSSQKATQAPTGDSPVVPSAMPPTMTQVPSSMPPSATIAPSMTHAPKAQAPQMMASPQGTVAPQSSYSIDDVIRLMRDLPDSKKEMVVIIVQKTLLSAKIDVGAIIDDASRKVDKLQSGNHKLIAEIRELEDAIIQKKAEVERVAKELEETNSVKQIFEATYGRHVKGEDEISNSAPMQIKL